MATGKQLKAASYAAFLVRLRRFLGYAGTPIGVFLLRGFAADSLVGKS